jgi:catechol 2,3-dioxygenase
MDGIIRPSLHHVTIKTTRLDEMVEWYSVVLGARVNFRDAMNAWTTNDAANHRIAFLSSPGLSDDVEKGRHNGMHHCAFEYATFADLMSSYARMRGLGIEPAFCLEHGLTISLYYRDPEGNFVELQSDNFGDWDKSSEWMRTSPEFAANPIGVFFDPAKVHEAHLGGTGFAELQAAIRAEKYLPATIPDIGLPPPSPPPAS